MIRKNERSVMKRQETGLDLIKVIMMFWIIMFHMANHSMIDLTAVPISWSWMFEAFCKLGGGGGGLFLYLDYRIPLP